MDVNKHEPPALLENPKPDCWPFAIRYFKRWGVNYGLSETEIMDVTASMMERHLHGVTKHGIGLKPGNGRIVEVDIIQEIMDSIVYIEQWGMEHEGNKAVETLTRMYHDRLFRTLIDFWKLLEAKGK